MKELVLTRYETGFSGTMGVLEGPELRIFTGELPWKNNQVSVSCIPTGKYVCKFHVSPRHGESYWLQDVPDRTEILIHAANWMGDTSKGYKSDLEGCIAVGMKLVKYASGEQDMLQKSAVAKAALIKYLNKENFILKVVNATGMSVRV